jgi:hypothetical protein
VCLQKLVYSAKTKDVKVLITLKRFVLVVVPGLLRLVCRVGLVWCCSPEHDIVV